jgi:hypothetical protein
MKLKMRDEDRRAIDLLLDRSAAAAGSTPTNSVYATTDNAIRQRVAPIEKVLGLLDAMPAEEPSSSLLSRTLGHIDRSLGRKVFSGQESQPHLYTH